MNWYKQAQSSGFFSDENIQKSLNTNVSDMTNEFQDPDAQYHDPNITFQGEYEQAYSPDTEFFGVNTSCPCCGEDNRIRSTGDGWFRCQNSIGCPLSFDGGYFSVSPEGISVSSESLADGNPIDVTLNMNLEYARNWANTFKKPAHTINPQPGDRGHVLGNDTVAWKLKGKVVVVQELRDDEYGEGMIVKREDGEGYPYLINISSFKKI